MGLPKYHKTFIPLLEILNSVESIKSRELAVKVRYVYYSDNVGVQVKTVYEVKELDNDFFEEG
jgi:hypothetical protein